VEKRTLKQTRVHKLVLNDMRDSGAEIGVLLPHLTYSEEDMCNFVESEVNPEGMWQDKVGDKTYNKIFKKGSDLEWYNKPVNIIAKDDSFGHGVSSEWIEDTQLKHLQDTNRVIMVAIQDK